MNRASALLFVALRYPSLQNVWRLYLKRENAKCYPYQLKFMKSPEIETYKAKYSSYMAFASRLQDLVSQLIEQSGYKMHFIESRAKTPESFAEKLIRPGKSYKNPFEEIPDLVGIRIVLYYTDNVLSVGNLLKQEFDVLEEVVGHQAIAYGSDQFGYLSMHYVVRLHHKRKDLPEWKDWREVRTEIQVRTVLQHSWAAVSHALQYKREGDVPLSLRRRLHRLAGLFELADEEFVAIRNEAATISKSTAAELEKNADLVPIDAQSLAYFFAHSSEFNKLRMKAKEFGFLFNYPGLTESEAKDREAETIGSVVEKCHSLSIDTVKDLNQSLNLEVDSYLKSLKADPWYISDAFLILLLLIKIHADAFTVDKLVADGWSKDIAQRVISSISPETQKGTRDQRAKH